MERRPGGLSAPSGVAARLLAGQVGTAAASLVINVLAARTLGPAGRGVLALGLQLAYVATTVCTAGADRSYPAARPLGRTPALEEAHGDVLRLVAGPTGGVLVVAAAAALLAPGLGGRGWLLVAFAAVLLGTVALVTLRTAATAAGRAGEYLAFVTASQVVTVGLTVWLAAASVRSAPAWLAVYGVGLLVPAAGLLLYRRPRLRPDHADFRRAARRTGLRLAPATVANMVMLRADRLLLPVFSTVEQLGLYVVVATVTETLVWPVQAYVDASVPRWAQADGRGELAVARLTAVLAGAVAAGVLALGWLITVAVVPVFGEQYRPSVQLVWPLTVAAGLYALSRLGVGLSIARGRAGHTAVIELTGMGVAVAAYLLLIPSSGALGAAWGCVAGYGAAAVAALVVAGRQGAGRTAAGRTTAPSVVGSEDARP